jgi:hypothetical protein
MLYLVADDRKRESIGRSNADLNVYENRYVLDMNKEERQQVQALKNFVGEGWTRVPSELRLSPDDLTQKGLAAAIENKDHTRIVAIAFKKNELVTPELQAKAAELNSKQIDGAMKYAAKKVENSTVLNELHNPKKQKKGPKHNM